MKEPKNHKQATATGVPIIKKWPQYEFNRQEKAPFGFVPSEQIVEPVLLTGKAKSVMDEIKRRGVSDYGMFKDQKDLWDTGDKYTGKSGGGYQPCYHTHPPLTFKDSVTGKEVTIHGGSCLSPKVKDLDVYIGLDGGMKFTPRHLPWNPGHEVRFPVIDHSHPKPEEMQAWKKMLHWVATQLREGQSVHVGCIGGHGRTGLLLSCLVKEMAGIDDAITYVRENYCKKVVESKSQVDWLFVNWGITKVDPAKMYSKGTTKKYNDNVKSYHGGGTSYTNSATLDYDRTSTNNIWQPLDKLADK